MRIGVDGEGAGSAFDVVCDDDGVAAADYCDVGGWGCGGYGGWREVGGESADVVFAVAAVEVADED